MRIAERLAQMGVITAEELADIELGVISDETVAKIKAATRTPCGFCHGVGHFAGIDADCWECNGTGEC